jgi:hypothetical protein
MTDIQTFFMVSGVIFWIVAFVVFCGLIAYGVLKDIPDPQPKGRTLNLAGYKRYNKHGRLE